MDYQKKNFPLNARVMIENTTDPILDGQTGTILGKSIVDVLDYYIVLLDVPQPDFRAITITEVCLKKHETEVSKWLSRYLAQQRWIGEHGGDLAGYIRRYGAGALRGEAIYAADLAELKRIHDSYRDS